MLKKTICLALVCLLSITLFCACTKFENQADTLSIVTTIFPPYDFSRELAGENADVTMLISPGTESHSYEPTPQDIIKIQNSDIFIYVGGKSDEWVNDILESMDTSKMEIITLMDCVTPVKEEHSQDILEEHTHEGEHTHAQYDEHIWTSPKNAILICEKIKNSLIRVDADNKITYESRYLSYEDKLLQLDDTFHAITENAKSNTLVFADRFPFRYLADEYSLNYFAAFPGCSSQTQPSAATVAALIDKVKSENIPVVFYIEFSSQKLADTICEGTNAKKLLLHSCHNVSKDDFENGASYIKLMTQNAEALKEALN